MKRLLLQGTRLSLKLKPCSWLNSAWTGQTAAAFSVRMVPAPRTEQLSKGQVTTQESLFLCVLCLRGGPLMETLVSLVMSLTACWTHFFNKYFFKVYEAKKIIWVLSVLLWKKRYLPETLGGKKKKNNLFKTNFLRSQIACPSPPFPLLPYSDLNKARLWFSRNPSLSAGYPWSQVI